MVRLTPGGLRRAPTALPSLAGRGGQRLQAVGIAPHRHADGQPKTFSPRHPISREAKHVELEGVYFALDQVDATLGEMLDTARARRSLRACPAQATAGNLIM